MSWPSYIKVVHTGSDREGSAVREVPITIPIKDVEREQRQPSQAYRQCASVLKSGRFTAVFCQRLSGHDGDHRGFRAQWRDVEMGD